MSQKNIFELPEQLQVSQFVLWERFDYAANDQTCTAFANAGAKYLAINTETSLRMSQEPKLLQNLVSLATRHGLIFRDAHAPWGKGWDLNELSTNSTNFTVHENVLRQLGDAGVKTYAIHVGAMVCYRKEWFGNEEHIRSVAARALERLLKTAESSGVVIAVENCFEPSTTASEALALVQRFSSPHIGICLDCGHANLMEPRSDRDITKMVDYIQRAWKPGIPCFTPGIPEFLNDEIVTVHLHDNDGLNDLHARLGSGIIDWQRYSALFACLPRLISLQSEVPLPPNSTPEEIFRDFALLQYGENIH